jgi:tRNA A37 threonylcarbamoyladenosine synthetase subunit TsaC/SUA5/YrdC
MNSSSIYLVQTDTTVGFLSQNRQKLSKIKQRDEDKPILRVVPSLAMLQRFTRIPKHHRKKIRRATKSTFIYPNGHSFRLICDKTHARFIQKFGWMYSTSANQTNHSFDKDFAYEMADIIVQSPKGFYEAKASKITKLGKKKQRKIR